MVFCEKATLDPVTMQLYDQLLRDAPIDYLEATEQYWLDDLYFIANAELPALSGHYLTFHYTEQ